MNMIEGVKKQFDTLSKNASKTVLSNKQFYWIVAITGILYAFTVFDLSFVLGESAYWKEPFGDTVTNRIGALYFAHDGWRWPLFYVPSLAFPEGASIVFTDSIPLLALIAKIIYKIYGVWFNYFGFWLFLCFPLLGLFIALAIKESHCKNSIAIVGGILLALSSPALLVRFGHAALMGQFLIAWSFFGYLKFRRTSSLWHYTLQFILVAILAVLIQMYFLLMVMPFFMAGLLQAVKDKRLLLRGAILSFAAVISSIIFVALAAGIIGTKSPEGSMFGFGYYSMNVLSPFLPPRHDLPNFISQHIRWDSNGYSCDATGGQYEGYNYLGAGMLFLLLIHSTALVSLLKKILKNHLLLFLSLLGLCLLALSTQIYIRDLLIIHIPLSSKLLGYFRTSGRLFWPIYYVLVVGLIAITVKRFSPFVARILIILAVVVQLVDTEFLRNNMLKVENKGFPQELSVKTWSALLAAHQFVKQYPSFQCGGWGKDWSNNNSNMEMLLLAAQQNIPTSSAYLARTSRNCSNERNEGIHTKIQPEGLYIFAKNFPIQEIQKSNEFSKWCREFKFCLVCTQKFSSQPAIAAFAEFKPVN